MDKRPELDLVGIGLGPANLSLAALAEPVSDLRCVFLERNDRVAWHPGLMLPEAKLQTSYLKDLVTPVDPTNYYSFVNFLVKTGRIYRFLAADEPHVSRREFEQYYSWVAQRLRSVRFRASVAPISFSAGSFSIRTGEVVRQAANVVVATGRRPRIPAVARRLLGADVLHASDYLGQKNRADGRRVLVIGGGQTGAELVHHLVDRSPPRELIWASRRLGFLPLDDSPFTNEWFNPRYVEHFLKLAPERRRSLLADQDLASNGASESTLRAIYRRLYALDFLEGAPLAYTLLPARELVDLQRSSDGLKAAFLDADTRETTVVEADLVLLATGYSAELPTSLDLLRPRVEVRDGWPVLHEDYSLAWDGPKDCRIFIQNGAERSHGIADPNLSLVAWRSALIVNSACGRTIYPTRPISSTIRWSGASVSTVKSFAMGRG